MRAAELLSELRSRDIKIRSGNGELVCDAPRGALTADLRAALSERKAEILAFLSDTSIILQSSESMPPAPRNKDLPLSFAQERLWVLEQLEPGSSAYHMPAIFRVLGALNTEALEQSLNEIVRRHEALRTTFTTVEDRPVQIIAAVTPGTATAAGLLRVPVIDLQDIKAQAEREAEALRRIGEELQRLFNLAADLMLRAMLFRLGANEHILVLVLHHIACDGWSIDILYRELSVLYECYSKCRPSPLPELPVQYADFAHWQRNWLQGEMLEIQVNYWKRQLRDLPVLELPIDHPRPALQTYRGSSQAVQLDKHLTDALKAMSQREGVTLFMILLAAFKVLLCRYTGQDDIVVGTPIAGRNRAEIEGLIGFFINTLVLRTDVSNNPSFRELLARVREVCLGAYTHQDLPFEKLVEELQPDRNLRINPLFQAWCVFDNAEIEPLKLSGLTINPMTFDKQAAKFDLALFMGEEGQRLYAVLHYNTDLFDEPTIIRMVKCFQTLLKDMATNPDKRIWDLLLWSDAETEKLVCAFNQA